MATPPTFQVFAARRVPLWRGERAGSTPIDVVCPFRRSVPTFLTCVPIPLRRRLARAASAGQPPRTLANGSHHRRGPGVSHHGHRASPGTMGLLRSRLHQAHRRGEFHDGHPLAKSSRHWWRSAPGRSIKACALRRRPRDHPRHRPRRAVQLRLRRFCMVSARSGSSCSRPRRHGAVAAGVSLPGVESAGSACRARSTASPCPDLIRWHRRSAPPTTSASSASASTPSDRSRCVSPPRTISSSGALEQFRRRVFTAHLDRASDQSSPKLIADLIDIPAARRARELIDARNRLVLQSDDSGTVPVSSTKSRPALSA